jgi:TolB-like protein/tetratricopeptide (TPR) repeat protein/tRNA A-37 threonylcarbamoyl transferase component Bud32
MSLGPGCLLGSYQILNKIGSGGMGEVYKAEDKKLGRLVAIKVLPPGLVADPERLRRFSLEARAVSALNHPNILTVHDLGEVDGSPFLVMELLEGKTLREKLDEGGLPTKMMLEIGIQIARGLAAAHEKGIIHRDLKPENLFITRDDRVKILDFGLAKLKYAQDRSLVSGDGPTMALKSSDKQTEAGMVMGTVAYMSPEQAQGLPLDSRSDLFSLGVVLWEMVTGARPFQRESMVATMQAIIHEEPPDLDSLLRVSPVLERVLRSCLSKSPEGRFHSAHDLAFALQSALEAGSAPSLSEGTRSSVHVFSLRRFWPWVAAGVIALGAVALSWAWPVSPGHAMTSLAVLPLQNYSGDAQQDYFVDGMTDALIGDLGQIKALKVISRTSVMQYKGGKKTLPEIAKELGVQGILEGSVMRAGNKVRVTTRLMDARQDRQIWSSSYERDLTDVMTLQREVVREIAAQIQVQVTAQEQGRLSVARTVDPWVYDTVLKARALLEYALTEQDIRRAMAMFRSAVDRSPDFAPAWAGLGEATWQLALGGFEYVAPSEVRNQAIAADEKALALDPDLPEAHNARAIIAIDGDWDLEKAKYHFEKALELRPGFANCRHAYGQMLLWGFQRYGEARRQFEMARESDPFSPWNGLNFIWWQTEQRHHEQALAEGERLRRENPSNWLIPSQMGVSLTALGRFPEAIRMLESGVAASGERNPFLLSHLGQAYGLAGQRKEAERILSELDQLSRNRYVSPQFQAVVLFGLGRNDEAYLLMEKAFSLRATALVMLAGPCEHQAAFKKDPRFTAYRDRIRQAIRMPKGSVAGVGP